MIFETALAEVKHLSFEVNGQSILQDVSLLIRRGEYCAIIGPNGGGKTTLIRLMLGLEVPTQGTVRLFGTPLKTFKSWGKIGYVPQRAVQIDTAFPATVYEVVKMGRTANSGWWPFASASDHAAVERAMEKMDVLHLRERLVGELSGGQRQRVMIARALASEPEMLILDEPNTGVDMASQHRFYELLRRLNREERLTVVFITHDVGVISGDIGRLFTVNRKLLTCNNPQEALSCAEMSKLYGIDAHALYNHHHHH